MSFPARAALVAVVAVAALMPSAGAECPSGDAATRAQATRVSLVLPEGCAAPFGGRLYDDAMRGAVRADLAQLEALVLATEGALVGSRGDLERCRRESADALDGCASHIQAIAAPPPTRLWAWSAAAGAAALAPLAACGLIECGSDGAPWAAALGGAALVTLLAWATQ